MKFAKIKSKETGVARCYDITVENNHNFFCNNILIHNCDYRNEVGVILMNLGDTPFTVKKGDRVAQLVFSRISRAVFEKASVLSSSGRSGGFGSTGI